jgi:hypothetical protein
MTVMTIQQPTIKITEYGSRTKAVRATVSRRKTRKEMKFLVKAPITYNPVTFTARAVDNKAKAGFRNDKPMVPPSKPEGKQIVDTDVPVIAPTDELILPASGVE